MNPYRTNPTPKLSGKTRVIFYGTLQCRLTNFGANMRALTRIGMIGFVCVGGIIPAIAEADLLNAIPLVSGPPILQEELSLSGAVKDLESLRHDLITTIQSLPSDDRTCRLPVYSSLELAIQTVELDAASLDRLVLLYQAMDSKKDALKVAELLKSEMSTHRSFFEEKRNFILRVSAAQPNETLFNSLSIRADEIIRIKLIPLTEKMGSEFKEISHEE